MATPHIQIPDRSIAEFCGRWRIREFSLFGSVLRDDFRPESDIDVVVSFDPSAAWSLLDLATMQQELGSILGRAVDLIEEEALRNPYRRAAILSSKQVIYAA
ncbi:MAG: nucleotidyltransferase family protein [Candidatus Atribacteria bacterium]|nr:nucleotidyltransferase family protein [Spirochaetota bacterium]MBE3118754.1 nucleotidyltransferase family protein [Candidatus Atribacteria bacterium]